MKIAQTSLVILAFGLVAQVNALPSTPKYKLDLVEGISITGGRATAISPNGTLVGTVNLINNTQAPFVYDTTVSAVVAPSGFSNVVPTGINKFGRMSGYGTRALNGGGTTTTALYWTSFDTVPVQIMPFDGYTAGKSLLYDVNDSGSTVGAANGWLVNGSNTINYQAMSYYGPNNTKQNHFNLTNAATGYAYFTAINSNGYMIGYSVGGDGKTHGVTRYGSTMQLAMDPAGTTNGADLRDVNTYNDVVGTSWASASQSKAFYRTQYGANVFIPRLAGATGDDAISAKSLNDDKIVVGQCEVGNTNNFGYIWDGTTTRSLNAVTSGLSTSSIVDAVSINNRNEVAVTVRNAAGKDFAARLLPVQTIQGRVTLQDWSLTPAGVPVYWETLDANSVVTDSGTFVPNILGMYSIETRHQGAGILRVKPSHWLARTMAIDTAAFDTLSQDFTFVNGDIDDDNQVTILDYIRLSGDYEWNSSMSGWSGNGGPAPKDSDLDGDGSVTILDYLILSASFEMAGE